MLSSHIRAKSNMVRPPALPVLIHALSSVSRHPVRSDSVFIVESRTGAVAWALCGNAPFPVPARQTGRADFPHPAFRLGSPRGTRRAPECGVCCQRAPVFNALLQDWAVHADHARRLALLAQTRQGDAAVARTLSTSNSGSGSPGSQN